MTFNSVQHWMRYVSVNIRHYLSRGGLIPRLIWGLW